MALVPLCHEFYEQQGCYPERVELSIPSLLGGPETSLFLTRFPLLVFDQFLSWYLRSLNWTQR